MKILTIIFATFIRNIVLSLNDGNIDCNSLGQNDYKNISYNCSCFYKSEENMLNIECRSFDDLNTLIFPDFDFQSIHIENAFSKWPKIPNAFSTLSSLNMGNNRIESIGNLNNLFNLQFLNMSFNLIEQLSPTICILQNLVSLDLSYNKIEFINFKSFFCFANYHVKTSSIEYLYLQGNQIKDLFYLDYFLFGFIFVKHMNMSHNKISKIEIGNITQIPVEMANQIVYGSKYGINMSSLVFDLSHNSIKRINLNLIHILHIFAEIDVMKKYISLKVSSFIFKSNPIFCDCYFYDDLKEMQSVTQNLLVSGILTESNLIQTNCINLNKTIEGLLSNDYLKVSCDGKLETGISSNSLSYINSKFRKNAGTYFIYLLGLYFYFS